MTKETGDIRSFKERPSNLEVIPGSVREASQSHQFQSTMHDAPRPIESPSPLFRMQ